MKTILSIAAAFAVSAAFIQAEDAKPAEAPKAEKPAAGDAFTQKDTDKDGFISKAEFTAGAKDAAKAEAAFTRKDADKDGKLSKEEFAAHAAHAGKGEKKAK